MIELKTAKYKGVEFLCIEMTTTGGNRLIKFNFPGSDKQSIERQGGAPLTFGLVAVIPHENYYQERDNLLRVLGDGEAGKLTHPTFGDVENIFSGGWTLTEKITELGRGQITIPFELDDAPGVPRQSGDLPAQVQVQSDVLNTQLAEDLSENYEVSRSFSDNFTDALDNLNEVADAIAGASEFANPLTDKIAAFRQTVNAFSGSLGALIQSPADLASSLRGLFEDLNTLYDTPGNLLGAFKLLFDFGDDDPEVVPTTVGRAERKQNRDLIRANMRAQALSYSYISAAEIEYESTEELDAVQADLESQYQDARSGPLLITGAQPDVSTEPETLPGQLLSNESIEQLDRLRVLAQKALDVAQVNARSVITVDTPRIPLTVLVFDYYGSTELVATIAELNNIKQNAFVEGEIRILTA